MKARKKPVVVDVLLWTSDEHQTEDPLWIIDAMAAGVVEIIMRGDDDCFMIIYTNKGYHHADRGDYIIRDVSGEIYPCKPDVFNLMYDII